MQGEAKLVKRFDKNGDKRLDRAERDAARKAVEKERSERGGFGPPGGGFGPLGGLFGKREVGKPGPKVTPADVATFPDKPLYDPDVLRTIFLQFERDDWEAELEAFYRSDVEVPATMIVDGKRYPNVGVHFRGMSSYFTVPKGGKRSFNLSLDFVDKDQRFLGAKTLNLLNCHGDASCLSTVLYSTIARARIPAPKANFVKVVVNGECWGVYCNVQQFDKTFLEENYRTAKGARWKVRGSPGGDGGLTFVGDDVEEYARRYELKSGGKEAWKNLLELCRVLHESSPAELQTALPKIMDVDGLLWFLALDVALINSDGYWTRASDYSIYLDPDGKFHVVPHDMNEAFRPAMGPGMRPGRGGRKADGPPPGFGPPGAEGGKGKGGRGFGPMFIGGMGSRRVDLDPLVGLDDLSKPLRSKVLQAPAWRAQYLRNIRELAERDLDWKNLGPIVAKHRALLAPELKIDTRKLASYEDFELATSDEVPAAEERTRPGPPGAMNLRRFADERRKFLLEWRANPTVGKQTNVQPVTRKRDDD